MLVEGLDEGGAPRIRRAQLDHERTELVHAAGCRIQAFHLDEVPRGVRVVGVDEVVRRDRSHPSIVTWVVNNEGWATFAAQDVLDRLEPERREAFVLTQLIGLPYAEAAEVVGCPIGTIRSRVARARAQLVELWHEPEQARRAV